MRPTTFYTKIIDAMRNARRIIDYQLAERNTQAVWDFISADMRKVFYTPLDRSNSNYNTFSQPTLPVMAAEMCPYAEAGIECRFFCAQCNLKHTCLYCAVEYRSRVKDVHLKRLITHSEYLDSLPEPPNFRAEDIISAGFAEKLRIAREAELERRRQVEIEAKEAEKRRLQAENEAKEAELERRRQVEIKAKEAEQRHRQTEIEAKEAEQRRRQAEDEARDRMNRLKESQQHDGDDGDDQHVESSSSEDESETRPSGVEENYSCRKCTEPDSADDMVECENAKRHGSKGAWFHLRCAGLSRSDLDASWYCPACQANESSDSPDEQDDSDDSNFNDKKPGSQRMRKPSQKPTSSRKGAVATSVGSGSNSRKNIKGGGSSNAALQTSSSTRPAYSQNAAEKNTSKWTNREGQMVAILMREVISEGVVNHTESRWDVVAARLSFRFAVDRTASAVKNYWNRYGRAANPSLDERRTARPDKLVTGVQDPVSRRKARGLKRKAASDEQDNVEEDNDEEDSDEASIPISRQIYSSKRRRI